jgi:ATP-binding cassette subfamily F protein uup
MPLINSENLTIAFGAEKLLIRASIKLDVGDRVCLIGRNGVGKTTLLGLLAGNIQPDSGDICWKPGVRISTLSQELPEDINSTVFEVLKGGLELIGPPPTACKRAVEDIMWCSGATPLNCWQWEQKIAAMISRMHLPSDTTLAELSGGWRRRVLLGRALVSAPDVLLLDEPTNHLDFDTIEWLENELLAFRGGLLFITHDRAFLQRLATSLLELEHGVLTPWRCDYATFLERKATLLKIDAHHNAKFDKNLANEEAWIRQGIKARRTRNEGRVRVLINLRKEYRQRNCEQLFKINSLPEQAILSGKLVIEVKNLSYGWKKNPLIREFSTKIMRGDRIGLVGANGSGKTTLLKLLLGYLPPDRGEVRHGTKLRIAYLDQLREHLNPEKTVIESVAGGLENVKINGSYRHIVGYLGDFMFDCQQVHSKVKYLSGGERNRLALACLFAQSANLLVMDEPTNDLDLETLQLLEGLLAGYTGTVLLVSHDRTFLDNVVTRCLVFEGVEGSIREYIGGYSNYVCKCVVPASAIKPRDLTIGQKNLKQAMTPLRLSYNEQRELELLPVEIEAMERRQQELYAITSDPAFYKNDTAIINHQLEELSILNLGIESRYGRWEELETMNNRVIDNPIRGKIG